MSESTRNSTLRLLFIVVNYFLVAAGGSVKPKFHFVRSVVVLAALISVSLAFSQTPVYNARPRIHE